MKMKNRICARSFGSASVKHARQRRIRQLTHLRREFFFKTRSGAVIQPVYPSGLRNASRAGHWVNAVATSAANLP
jgi:hypothetical protein